MSPSASDIAAPRSSVLNKEYLKSLMPAVGKISEQDLLNTPLLVFQLLCILIVEVGRLYKCVGELNARLRQNSTNSNKSPSSDPPGQGQEENQEDCQRKKRAEKTARAPAEVDGPHGKTRYSARQMYLRLHKI